MIKECPLTLSDDRTVLVKCDNEYNGVVEIPDGVTRIGFCALYGCSGLTYIKIPNSVTNIGEEAIEDCRELASIEIPIVLRV